MKRKPLHFSLLIAFVGVGFYGECTAAATATNLVTICTSAKAVTQAAKCTAWQYNVYSPTAYMESYPQVTPGPSGYTDPAYEYRLGSTITPTMGVKVCPVALVPGTSYTSAAADPCPNNKLVTASTVLPTDSYAITTSSGGIVVYQINESGVSVVSGSPFLPTPVPTGYPPGTSSFPAPTLTALDPAGQYLYALYNTGLQTGAVIYSYRMVDGVPSQVSISSYFGGGCGGCESQANSMIATAQHVYVANACSTHSEPLCVDIWTTKNGVLSSAFDISGFGLNTPVAIAVDAQEQFLYWYFSSSGGTVADTVAIFSLNFSNSSATLVQVMPQQGVLLLGAK